MDITILEITYVCNMFMGMEKGDIYIMEVIISGSYDREIKSLTYLEGGLIVTPSAGGSEIEEVVRRKARVVGEGGGLEVGVESKDIGFEESLSTYVVASYAKYFSH